MSTVSAPRLRIVEPTDASLGLPQIRVPLCSVANDVDARVLLILSTRTQAQWAIDSNLGSRIDEAARKVRKQIGYSTASIGSYGSVCEVAPVNLASLGLAHGYTYKPITQSYTACSTRRALEVEMLREAAGKLGYDLTPRGRYPL